ncbi:MAG: DUF1579 domain-containing protein [bacterium]|nr:DUF1579 domain-containing protein [bacterium]
MFKVCSAVLVTALAALGASAQPVVMKPGEAQRKLDFMVGEWTIASKMYMRDEVHGGEHRSEIRWLPGGVWLEQSTEMKGTPIGDMFGSARIAWDDIAEEYVRTWIDNQSHVTMAMRGSFADDGTLEFSGSFEWIDGSTFHQRLTIHRESDGWSMKGYMGQDPEALRLNHEGRATKPAAKSGNAP